MELMQLAKLMELKKFTDLIAPTEEHMADSRVSREAWVLAIAIMRSAVSIGRHANCRVLVIAATGLEEILTFR